MDRCILCSKIVTYRPFKSIEGIDIYKCDNCQLGFLDEKNLAKQKNLNKQTNYSLREYIKNDKLIKSRFSKLYQQTNKYKGAGTLLDVGAGFGLFASIFAKNGYSVTAIEPINDLHYLKEYKHKAVKKSLTQFLKSGKKLYDVILMIDILEHLVNPLQSLKFLSKRLKKDGIIVIQTPNYKSLMARICKNWSWWMVEDHKYFFLPRTLKEIMRQSGYRSVYLKTYENVYDFKKNLDGNFRDIGNIIIRRLYKAVYFAVFFPLYFVFRKLLWKLGYGGLIFAIFKKNE